MTGTVRLPLLIINSKSVPEFRIRLTESRWLLLTKSSYFSKKKCFMKHKLRKRCFSTLTRQHVLLLELTYTLAIYRFNDITNLNKVWLVSWTVLYKSENIQWQIIFLKEWLLSFTQAFAGRRRRPRCPGLPNSILPSRDSWFLSHIFAHQAPRSWTKTRTSATSIKTGKTSKSWGALLLLLNLTFPPLIPNPKPFSCVRINFTFHFKIGSVLIVRIELCFIKSISWSWFVFFKVFLFSTKISSFIRKSTLN